jgi:hypothetical protein
METFTVSSPYESVGGKTFSTNVVLNTSTSEQSGNCVSGLPIYSVKALTIGDKSMSIITTKSLTNSSEILNLYTSDEAGLKAGGMTSSCLVNFASQHGDNRTVTVGANFNRRPQAGDQAQVSVGLTTDEYNNSQTVKQAMQTLESLSY